MVVKSLCALCLLLLPYGAAQGYEALATAHVAAMPPMTYPDYLQTVTDPAFGTPFTRVTDPGQQMLPDISCKLAYCTHRYSSSQAWNADQSLLLIANGCSGLCFLDGSTYAPLFHRTIPNECEWHPVDPALMICVSGNEIYTWDPRLDIRTAVYAFDDYNNLQFGPYKGNPSKDGTMLVVRATNREGTLVAFAYDMSTQRKYPDIDLTNLSGHNGYCTISPSGRYVFCSNETFDGTDIAYVFTTDGVQLQHWTEHHRPGHGDMTIDTDGSDVYVGISKANPDKYHIIKRRLDNGAVTDLTPYGNGQHASTRNINRPGWVFVTYSGTYPEVAGHPSVAPFYEEVVALRIDGSGELRRVIQTRNSKYDYWSETHASPSPDGSQIIWSSNWGRPGGPVADFVARLSWPKPTMVGSSMHQ
jgi:WD40-like Beta Propeller Repeat